MTPVGHHPLVGQRLRSVGASDDEAPSAESSIESTSREMQRLYQEQARDAVEAASQADDRASIPTRDLTRLYRSFEQRTLPAGDRPGYGVGARTDQTTVEMYGETIDVESELGVGPTFTVRIPVA